jgi:hypothetical protein
MCVGCEMGMDVEEVDVEEEAVANLRVVEDLCCRFADLVEEE